jgi:hypothetical protein
MAYTIRETDAATITIPAGESAQIQPPASEAGQTYFEMLDVSSPSRDPMYVGGPNVSATNGALLSVYRGSLGLSGSTLPRYDRRIFHRDDLPYVFNGGTGAEDVTVAFRVVTGTL